jgi:hypothetical protein
VAAKKVTTTASAKALDPATQSASEIIAAQLKAWGLSSLTAQATKLLKQGLTSSAVTLQLAATREYKERFAANETRVKRGLAALSPGEYISAENSYRQVLHTYGLPTTFYDSQADYRKFLENDLSPAELNDRAKVAQATWLSADRQVREVWRDWYGLSDGAAIASILDPKTALPIVQSMAEAAKAGGAALRNGLNASQSRIRQYVDQGLSAEQISQGFNEIGLVHEVDQSIGRRFGIDLNQAVEEHSRIQGLASAARAQADAYASEKALFDARPGADKNSLSRRTTGSY